MYRKDDEILIGHPAHNHRRKVLMVDGDKVWYVVGNTGGNMADRVPITNTFPLPPAGREVESEWRVPKIGDIVYDRANGWMSAEDWGCDVPDPFDDPLGFGWRRPVLVPLPAPKPNRVRGIIIGQYGAALLDEIDGGVVMLLERQGLGDERLAELGYSPADIALIRAGLPADVKAYLDSKPQDAEAKLRVPKLEEVYRSKPFDGYQCWNACTNPKGDEPDDVPYLGRRRWIRKAATPGTVTTMEVTARRAEDAQHRMTAENCETLRQENAKLRAQVERLKAIIGTIKESLQ